MGAQLIEIFEIFVCVSGELEVCKMILFESELRPNLKIAQNTLYTAKTKHAEQLPLN